MTMILMAFFKKKVLDKQWAKQLNPIIQSEIIEEIKNSKYEVFL